jgi:hypothetical protein
MTSASYRTTVAEQAATHEACCRYRRQGLVCSTCCELADRLARAERAAAATREAA